MTRYLIIGLLSLSSLLAVGDEISWSEASWGGGVKRMEGVRSAPVDLRIVFTVAKLSDEPALQNLAYSAIGWEREAVADASRKVTVTAQSGTLVNDNFLSDGEPELTVLPETTGRGTCNWTVRTFSKCIYRLTHVVSAGGVVDASATLYGYLDFTHCEGVASQKEVKAAVLGSLTHEIDVVQDADWPWQPIDLAVVRAGIKTDGALPAGTETATTFAFSGCGVFHYEYALSGGNLAIWVDGEKVLEPDVAVAWQGGQLAFADCRAHDVVFAYVAGGDGTTAALRNVVWEESEGRRYGSGLCDAVQLDLQEGVRTAEFLTDILPFAYSSTNWVGDVTGADAASVARVTVVQLTGTDSDVQTWTNEVPNTRRVLAETSGEGEVRWRGKGLGVWKATFDILDGDDSLHQESVIFDLRTSRYGGFYLLVR